MSIEAPDCQQQPFVDTAKNSIEVDASWECATHCSGYIAAVDKAQEVCSDPDSEQKRVRVVCALKSFLQNGCPVEVITED